MEDRTTDIRWSVDTDDYDVDCNYLDDGRFEILLGYSVLPIQQSQSQEQFGF